MMKTFDLATAWCWEYDADFTNQIDGECLSRGIGSYLIHPDNLSDTLQKIEDGELQFKIFLDRASDQDAAFDRLVEVMKDHRAKMINQADYLGLATDKAAMQKKLSSENIGIPYTVILPPWHDLLQIRSFPADRLGTPFVVKPACGGCGDGVVKDARTARDIQRARQEFPYDRYLLQERIEPIQLDGRRAWFRIFFAFGEILPCWWDNHTKVADVLSPSDVDQKVYSRIKTVMRKIARICRLEMFSTEIALTSKGRLVVIDPVNDQVDLRKKSSHPDGIPDQVVDQTVKNLVDWVQKRVHGRSRPVKSVQCTNP
jgi:hypothetical protein